MFAKIRFYKRITIEVLETLQTICFVVSQSRNPPTYFRNDLIGHADCLREFSEKLRHEMADDKKKK